MGESGLWVVAVQVYVLNSNNFNSNDPRCRIALWQFRGFGLLLGPSAAMTLVRAIDYFGGFVVMSVERSCCLSVCMSLCVSLSFALYAPRNVSVALTSPRNDRSLRIQRIGSSPNPLLPFLSLVLRTGTTYQSQIS